MYFGSEVCVCVCVLEVAVVTTCLMCQCTSGALRQLLSGECPHISAFLSVLSCIFISILSHLLLYALLGLLGECCFYFVITVWLLKTSDMSYNLFVVAVQIQQKTSIVATSLYFLRHKTFSCQNMSDYC